MSSSENKETKELVKELESVDPEIGDLIKEEKSLLNVIQDKEKRGDNVEQLEETVEDAHEETAEKIKDVLTSDPNSLKKVKKLVESRLKEYGGIEKTLERLKNVDLNKIPRFLKKQLRKHLPALIRSLKKKKMSPELIDILEDLNKKVEDNLVSTKPKKWWRRKGGKRKTMKKGGNNGEGAMFAMAWIAFLITCCCTGVGCFICGPLLVVTFCGLFPELCQGILAVGQAIGNVVIGIGEGIFGVGDAMVYREGTTQENNTDDKSKTYKVKITKEMKDTNSAKMGQYFDCIQELRKITYRWKQEFNKKNGREPTVKDEAYFKGSDAYQNILERLKEIKYIEGLTVGDILELTRERLKIFDLTPEDLTNKKGGSQTKKQRRHK